MGIATIAVKLKSIFGFPTLKADKTALIAPDGSEVSLVNTPVDASFSVAKCGVPIGIAPSGTMGANGAVTLGTALNIVYSAGVWLYFPAGAVFTDSVAGFYWTVMTGTTAGVVYNTTYTPGVDSFDIPTSPVAVVAAGAGAWVGETAYKTALSFVIPGGSLGNHGVFRSVSGVTVSSTGGSKAIDNLINGISFGSYNITNTPTNSIVRAFQNRGTPNVQFAGRSNQPNSESYSASVAVIQMAHDTTQDVTITVWLDIAVATDYIVLENYYAEIQPDATNIAVALPWHLITPSSSIAIDYRLGAKQKILAVGVGNTIAAPTNATDGATGTIKIQGGTNSPLWAAAWDFGSSGAPIVPASAAYATIVEWVNDGGTFMASYESGFGW